MTKRTSDLLLLWLFIFVTWNIYASTYDVWYFQKMGVVTATRYFLLCINVIKMFTVYIIKVSSLLTYRFHINAERNIITCDINFGIRSLSNNSYNSTSGSSSEK